MKLTLKVVLTERRRGEGEDTGLFESKVVRVGVFTTLLLLLLPLSLPFPPLLLLFLLYFI